MFGEKCCLILMLLNLLICSMELMCQDQRKKKTETEMPDLPTILSN